MKNNSKHIVLLTPGFPENEDDSTTIPALQIYIKALKKLNPQFDIKVITFQYPFSTEIYNWFDVNVYPLNGRNKKINKIAVWKKANKLLTNINNNKLIDIIHSFWIGECAYVGDKFSNRNQIKHVITSMGQDIYNNYFNLFLISKNNTIVSLSKNQKKLLFNNTNRKSIIIPWGINPENFPKPQEKTIDILGVGSINHIKNFKLFINVIIQLQTKIKNLKVEIIGDGNLKTKIENQINSNNLSEIIYLTGNLSRIEVLKKMSTAKILLHTSSYESFGMVFLEALQSQMKIVSFNVGFAKHSNNWRICKTNNNMIDELEKLLINYCKPDETETFLINKTIKKYLTVYNE